MKVLWWGLSILVILVSLYFFLPNSSREIISGAPPYGVVDDAPDMEEDEYAWIDDWVRPQGPAKVALQAGHYKNDEIPDELHRLRGNTGATGGGKSEWEVNLEIAELTAEMLEARGITVEILPATVPESYWADVFVSIHADGSLDSTKTGFKAAAPRRDVTGKADELLSSIEKEYAYATAMEKDPNVTRNMRGYYAFGWWRYDHAVHPMTTSVILETGFLTSPQDRLIIVEQPEISAQGLASGIIEYLEIQDLI